LNELKYKQAWLEEQNNRTITDVCNFIQYHKLSKAQKQFFDKALKINQKGMAFNYFDFPELSKGNYRQYVLKLKPILEVVIKSKPCFYKIKGIVLPSDPRKITRKVTGYEIMLLLENLKSEPATLHDIKIKFSSNLHDRLAGRGFKENSSNKGIIIPISTTEKYVTVKALVYPKTIQIDIGRTFKPLVYDISGVIQLSRLLGQIQYYLTILGGDSSKITIPPPEEWIVTHYHFGKDSSESYTGQTFEYTFGQVGEGFIRYYSKVLPGRSMITRAEKIVTPQIPVDVQMDKMIQHALKDI